MAVGGGFKDKGWITGVGRKAKTPSMCRAGREKGGAKAASIYPLLGRHPRIARCPTVGPTALSRTTWTSTERAFPRHA